MTMGPENWDVRRLKYEDPNNPDPLRTLALVLAGVVRGAPLPRRAYWEIRRLIMEHPERTKRPPGSGYRSGLEKARQFQVDFFRYLEVEPLRRRTGLPIGEELFETAAQNLADRDKEQLLRGPKRSRKAAKDSSQAIRDSYYRAKRTKRREF
jgi:hypothetical protein